MLKFVNLMSLPSASSITLYVNIAVGVILLLAFLIGFKRGLFKTTYMFVATLTIVIIFWAIAPVVTKAILNFDVSGFNLDVSGYNVDTFNGLIEHIMVNNLGMQATEGVVLQETLLYQTIYSVAVLVVRIVLLIFAFIMNITLFRFILWIIYLIVRPKVKDKKGRTIKKKWWSRLGGAGVSMLNAVLSLLILFVPLSAILSLGDTAAQIANSDLNAGEKLVVSYDGNKLNMSASDKSVLEVIGLDEEIINIIGEYGPVYRNTIPGVLYSFNISGTDFDTYLFDKLLEVEAGDKSFSIRKELQTVLEVVKVIDEKVVIEGEELQIVDVIDKLSEEDIDAIFTKLSELEVISFTMPIAFETFEIMLQSGSELTTAYVDYLDFVRVLKDTDLDSLIADIGDIVSSTKGLLDESGLSISEITGEGLDINKLLTLNENKLQQVLDNVAKLSVIDELYNAVIKTYEEQIDTALNAYMVMQPKVTIGEDLNYYINGVNSTYAARGENIDNINVKIDMESKVWVIEVVENEEVVEELVTTISCSDSYYEISLDGIVVTDEIKNLGNIYSSFKKLGITDINSLKALFDETITDAPEIDYSKFTYDNLNGLSASLLNSKVISKAAKNIMVIVNNILPNEYHNMVVVPENVTSEDLTSILVLGKVVLESGLLKQGEEINYTELISEYKDDLVEALKGSNLILSNLTPVIGTMMDMVFGPDIIIIPEDLVWGSEVDALFDSIEYLSSAIDFETQEVKLSQVDREKLAEAMSRSRILTGSMNNVIKYVLSSVDLGDMEISIREDIEWDYDEIYSVLEGANIILELTNSEEELSSEELLQKFIELSDEDIDIILGGSAISSLIVGLLCDMAAPEGALEGLLIINNSKDDYDFWLGTSTEEGELKKILKSAKGLLQGVQLTDNDNMINDLLNNVVKLTNNLNPSEGETDEVGNLLDSVVLRDTIINQIVKLPESVDIIVVNMEASDPKWVDYEEGNETKPGELRNIFSAINVIFTDEEGNVNVDFENFDVNFVLDLSDEEIDDVLKSQILCDSIEEVLYGLDDENEDIVINEITDLNTELKSIVKAIPLVFGEDVDLNNLTVDTNEVLTKVVNLTNNINGSTEDQDQVGVLLGSQILSDTIIRQIELNEKTEDGGMLVFPDNSEEINWRDSGNNPGELRNILGALKVIFKDGNVNLEEIDANIILDLEVKEEGSNEEDDVDVILRSKVLELTIKDMLEELDDDNEDIVVNEITDLNAELRALVKSIPLVFGDEVDLNNLTVDTNEVLTKVVNLTNNINANTEDQDQVGVLLGSQILSDTIIRQIELNEKTEDGGMLVFPDNSEEINWRDSGNNPGELRNILGALRVVFTDGNVNLDEIDANIIVELEEEKLDTVFTSEIMLLTFYDNLHELTSGTGSLNGVIYIKEGTEETKEEAIQFIQSIQVVFGETGTNLNTMTLETFDINVFMKFDDDEIDTFLASSIISYSAAYQVLPILSENGELYHYVNLNTTTEEDKVLEVEEDLPNLIKVIRDLNAEGIPYDEFNFAAFETAINNTVNDLPSSATLEEINAAKDAKADSLAEVLLQSQILTQSLDKMFEVILSETLSDEYMELVQLPLSSDPKESEKLWKGEGTDEGELKRIMRVVASINAFASEGANNSDIDNPEELTIPLKKVNHSLVLHGLLPKFVNTATANVDSWRKVDENGDYVLPETVEAWDIEIDVLAQLIIEVKEIDLAHLVITGDGAIDANKLGDILYLINDSVMIDIEKVVEPLEIGVEKVFDDIDVTLGNVTPREGQSIHDAWDEEIAKLVTIVPKLQAINALDLYGSNAEANATAIGEFLDAATESHLLAPAIDAIIDYLVGPLLSYPIIGPMIQEYLDGDGTYTEKLVNIVQLL